MSTIENNKSKKKFKNIDDSRDKILKSIKFYFNLISIYYLYKFLFNDKFLFIDL